jgi:hypothetical protein
MQRCTLKSEFYLLRAQTLAVSCKPVVGGRIARELTALGQLGVPEIKIKWRSGWAIS